METVTDWSQRSHRDRCRLIGKVRHAIANMAQRFIVAGRTPQRPNPADTVSAELLPLCDALKFIGRRGADILKTQYLGIRGRPVWMWGVRSEIHRVPLGEVLVIAPWNYPLLLAGVQCAQALAAGNRVWLKPAPGCERVTLLLHQAFLQAGVPAELFAILDSDPAAAQQKITDGMDLVVLTGGTRTGQKVMQQCAETLTPSIMELSGCDAMIVGPKANLKRVADALYFGLRLNGGATCIGPRRLLVPLDMRHELMLAVRKRFVDCEPIPLHPSAQSAVAKLIQDAADRGAIDAISGRKPLITQPLEKLPPTILDQVQPDWPIASADLFAPVISVLTTGSDQEAIQIVNHCPYRLAASVFGEPGWCQSIAERLDVGHVSINDVLFPTIDPRVPFGGCDASGFGVTRGAEGLLAMTRPKVIARHRGRIYFHLKQPHPSDYSSLMKLLQIGHAGRDRS